MALGDGGERKPAMEEAARGVDDGGRGRD